MKSQYEIQVEYQYQQAYYQSEESPILKTAEDRHHYAMFKKGNKYNSNGRTWIFVDEHGEHVSSFVSQYSNIIDNNLERGVKDAVLALHNKGYLTFTSCQGHSDTKYRYIGVVFSTTEQKTNFIKEVTELDCDVHWYDNSINTIERPATELPWWADGIRLHIVYDDNSFEKSNIIDRRDKPYTDEELTKFWNIQMCRSYTHYEAVIFSFGYPLVEKSLWEKTKKVCFHNQYKITSSYYNFLNKVQLLSEYDC